MKKDIVMPIAVLVVICLVISAALAVTNNVTKPVIDKGAAERAEAARAEIIPEAQGFVQLSLDGMPASISEAYGTLNDVGYVFTAVVTGYGGDMTIMCGIANDGTIIMCKTLSHSETKGMGSKTADEPFRSQFVGVDSTLDGVSAITGATISSKAYLGAVNDIFTAYEAAKEAA